MPFLSRSKVMVGVHEREESAVATNSPAVAGQGGASTTDCLPCRHLPRCLCNINIPQNNKRKREVEEKEEDLATATEVTFLSMMGEMKDLLEQNSDQMTQMQVEIRHLRAQVVSMKGLLERHVNNGNDYTNANLPLQAAEVAVAAAVEAGHAAARAKRMEISATATATAEQITTQTPTPTVLQQTPPRQVYYKTPEDVRKMIGQRIVKRNSKGVEVDVNGNPLNAEQIMKEGGGQEEEAKVDAQNGHKRTRNYFSNHDDRAALEMAVKEVHARNEDTTPFTHALAVSAASHKIPQSTLYNYAKRNKNVEKLRGKGRPKIVDDIILRKLLKLFASKIYSPKEAKNAIMTEVPDLGPLQVKNFMRTFNNQVKKYRVENGINLSRDVDDEDGNNGKDPSDKVGLDAQIGGRPLDKTCAVGRDVYGVEATLDKGADEDH